MGGASPRFPRHSFPRGDCFFLALSAASALASLTTFAPIAYPEMRKVPRMIKALAAGAICVGATMDIMIPPSLSIYSTPCYRRSIGKLFIAGFIPGALEVLLFA